MKRRKEDVNEKNSKWKKESKWKIYKGWKERKIGRKLGSSLHLEINK